MQLMCSCSDAYLPFMLLSAASHCCLSHCCLTLLALTLLPLTLLPFTAASHSAASLSAASHCCLSLCCPSLCCLSLLPLPLQAVGGSNVSVEEEVLRAKSLAVCLVHSGLHHQPLPGSRGGSTSRLHQGAYTTPSLTSCDVSLPQCLAVSQPHGTLLLG